MLDRFKKPGKEVDQTVKILGRDDILKAEDIRIEPLDVPEWGGRIYVKTLSGEERDQLEASLVDYKTNGQPKRMKTEKLRASIAALAICDEKGNRLFTPIDISALAKKSSAALDRVAAKAQEMSGISEGDVDRLTENLKKDQPEDSHSS